MGCPAGTALRLADLWYWPILLCASFKAGLSRLARGLRRTVGVPSCDGVLTVRRGR